MSRNALVKAERLNPALISTPQEGAQFIGVFNQAVAAARAIGADRDVTNKYAEKLVRSVRRTGELIRELPRSKGGRGKTNDTAVASFIANAGTTRRTIERWQSVASLAETTFEGRLEEIKAGDDIIALSAFYGLAAELNATAKKEQRKADVDAQAAELALATPSAPLGLFNVIAIDPPWPYDEGKSAETYDPAGHRASNPYPEMSLEQIGSIALPSADDCALWLWTTHKFMRHAFPLLDRWGFEDKAILTWVKDRMGLGTWLRSQSEFCILAVRGSPVITLTNQTTVINAPLREHSRKPDEFYALVDGLCYGRKLDYFSRQPRDGWEQFGNDPSKFTVE